MSDPRDGPTGRGPLGSSTNRPRRQRRQAPADKNKSGLTPSIKKAEYLALAKTASYAMQGRSAYQSTVAVGDDFIGWVREVTKAPTKAIKPRRVQSFLGGAFLRMYLDGKVDPDAVADAGDEIGESKEFAALIGHLQAHLQSMIRSEHLVQVKPDHLLNLAERCLDAKKKSKEGIAFRNTLNTVIGGITNVDVERVELLAETPSSNGVDRKYSIGIIFSDVYDFANDRSGEYDVYRKKLARLLMADKFAEFEEAFGQEVSPLHKHKTKLDDAAVFASFMYALEKKGWTPGGLPWQVTVPAEVTLHFPNPAPAKAVRRHSP